MHIPFKLKTLMAALVVTLPGIASTASAASFGMDFQGYVTLLTPGGVPINNPSFAGDPRFQGWRTPISGKMVMDIGTNGLRGTASFTPFLFFDFLASGENISFVPVSTVLNIPTSSMLLGNMSFNWNANNGIPVSIVLDMGNLTTALMQSSPGAVIDAVLTPASDNTLINGQTMPIGPSVVATTTWNTTDVDTDQDGNPGPVAMGANPSGGLPLLVDTVVDTTNGDLGIGGSPMKVGPFTGFNANFDITEVTVTCVDPVGSCSSDSVIVPPVPLSPQPLAPIKDAVKSLLP